MYGYEGYNEFSLIPGKAHFAGWHNRLSPALPEMDTLFQRRRLAGQHEMAALVQRDSGGLFAGNNLPGGRQTDVVDDFTRSLICH